ncbi:MAG: acyltransferase [Bacteroidales bacterium]|jgi:acetyltransferase-like isoleucine patch superfamily enzyme
MGFGIAKFLRRIQVLWNVNEFSIRKKVLGFDNANTFLHRLDKNSMSSVLRENGAIIGLNCSIEGSLIFHNCKDYSNLIVGNNCHIGKSCFFDLRSKVRIEDNVVISMQTTFITHLDLNNSELRKIYHASTADIHICKNCYIGTGVIILQGVQLGKSSIIAAGSVVTNNVDPYTMVGGVPAKVIKKLQIFDGG